MDALRIKFWGTRGIIPSPRKTTSEFGGNTTCIQIIHNEHIILIDTGYGVALLGETLLDRILKEKENLEIHIFYTHFHWDHILGLPFFHPIYFPSTQLHLYAPIPEDEIWENLNVLFDGSYSPFSGIDSMPSKIKLHHLTGPIRIDDLDVSFIPVEHHIHGNERSESSAYAYRFRTSKYSAVVATDHEAKKCAVNDEFVEFSKNATILIHDAQFTEKDVLVGWGHSTVTEALDNARRIKPKITLLTHHDPERNDDEIFALDAEYKARQEYKGVKFEFAREGHIYDASTF
jgi:phosphoribosyl 1,2-cyclic phosphodiesterase